MGSPKIVISTPVAQSQVGPPLFTMPASVPTPLIYLATGCSASGWINECNRLLWRVQFPSRKSEMLCLVRDMSSKNADVPSPRGDWALIPTQIDAG